MKNKKIITLLSLFLFSQMAFGEKIEGAEYCEKIFNVTKSQTNSNGTSNIPDYPIWVVKNKKRTWFYNAPDEKCRSNAFIIEGDLVIIYKTHKNYGYISYYSKDNIETKGWVSLSNLSKFNLASYKGNEEYINVSDFTITNGKVWITLNESYHLFEKRNIAGKQNYHNFIGGFMFGDYYYKFNQHDYNDFSLVTSNVNYDKRLMDMDGDYIISSITLKNRSYETLRGVKIGDSVDKVMDLYNHIPYNNNGKEIIFSLADMELSFELKDDKVSSISMGFKLEEN
ncbi:hypothetical protein ID854_13965 [Xenorhabdus sp. M]|uniref:Uncharacterized protein n=1 Tax=Xenorhabdus szentirmaii TaxID=290112 RepID=A0AAW3YTQ6_9GAMM|nr:hypothetical protein [Xenorhabdus sp. M]MBD2801530.1 hypothetical protein [Xenorhabdus sp. M]